MEITEPKETADSEVSKKIASLPGMEKASLCAVWKQAFQSPAPVKLRKQLMVPILAYRLQELAYGGLSQSARKRIQGLIAKNRAQPARSAKPIIPAEGSGKLVRSWRGEIHEVFLIESGYIYKGETYKTLSPIAKRITGTPWSGPAFFGTRPQDRRR